MHQRCAVFFDGIDLKLFRRAFDVGTHKVIERGLVSFLFQVREDSFEAERLFKIVATLGQFQDDVFFSRILLLISKAKGREFFTQLPFTLTTDLHVLFKAYRFYNTWLPG